MMGRIASSSIAAALLSLAPFAAAGAQCPDGTPPPCMQGVARGVTRRPVPAMSARTWIVAPFANVTRAPDLEWLRDASVNLLSLDLGRWTDIVVVDDKRVADLVRTAALQKGSQALSLDDGLALARRAGAGCW